MRAAERRGQLLATYGAWRVEIGRSQRMNAFVRVSEGPFDCIEQRSQRLLLPFPALLCFQAGELHVRELAALRIRENAVNGTGNVAQKECYGRKTERLRVNLGVSKTRSPFAQVVERKLKRMQDGAAGSGNVGVRAAEPGFGVRSGGSAHGNSLKL